MPETPGANRFNSADKNPIRQDSPLSYFSRPSYKLPEQKIISSEGNVGNEPPIGQAKRCVQCGGYNMQDGNCMDCSFVDMGSREPRMGMEDLAIFKAKDKDGKPGQGKGDDRGGRFALGDAGKTCGFVCWYGDPDAPECECKCGGSNHGKTIEEFRAVQVASNPNVVSGGKDETHWKCLLVGPNGSMEVLYTKDPETDENIDQPPTIDEVLTSIVNDANNYEYNNRDFESFAEDNGFDTSDKQESQSAQNVFRNIQRQSEKLQSIFGDYDYDNLLERGVKEFDGSDQSHTNRDLRRKKSYRRKKKAETRRISRSVFNAMSDVEEYEMIDKDQKDLYYEIYNWLGSNEAETFNDAATAAIQEGDETSTMIALNILDRLVAAVPEEMQRIVTHLATDLSEKMQGGGDYEDEEVEEGFSVFANPKPRRSLPQDAQLHS